MQKPTSTYKRQSNSLGVQITIVPVHILAVHNIRLANASNLPTMTILSTLSDTVLNDWKSSSCIVGGVLAFLYIANALRVWHRLRHVPGPPWVGLSKWWLIRAHARGRTHLDLAEMSQKYGTKDLSRGIGDKLTLKGKLARIGPNDLVTSDPDLLRRMLGVRSPYSRAPYYQGFRFDPSKDNLLSQTDERKHGVLRAKMAAGVRFFLQKRDLH